MFCIKQGANATLRDAVCVKTKLVLNGETTWTSGEPNLGWMEKTT
jgi:hypothetical protein